MLKQITSFILLLLLFGCTPADTWNFSTDYFRIEINNEGYITSMKNKTVLPHREFSPLGKPSPLMSLYNSEKKEYYYPQKASYNRLLKELKLDYPNGSIATISLQPKDK